MLQGKQSVSTDQLQAACVEVPCGGGGGSAAGTDLHGSVCTAQSCALHPSCSAGRQDRHLIAEICGDHLGWVKLHATLPSSLLVFQQLILSE